MTQLREDAQGMTATATAPGGARKHAALAPGDRGPNFVLPDAEGRVRMLYERVRGNPYVLLLAGDPAAPAARAALDGFARDDARLEAAALDLVVVVRGDSAAAGTLRHGGSTLLFADPLGKITAAYCAAAGFPAAGPACLLFDGNQRLLAARAPGEDAAAWALAQAAAHCPPRPGRVAASAAPVLVVPRVLDSDECRALIARWESGHEDGTVGSVVGGTEVERVYDQAKRRRDHRIMDQADNARLADLVGRRIAPELNKAFHFREFRFDRFIVTCYDAERGDYFRRHRDNISPGTADRRFALTLNLNTEAYEGGELWFPEYGPDRYRPETGAAILFSCSLLHEALPVTRGRRFTLLNFLRDIPQGGARPAPR